MNQETKIIGGIALVTMLIVIGAAFFLGKPGAEVQTSTKPVDKKLLIKNDSFQTLPKARVTVVEFADFQCPACGAAYPTIKAASKEYKDVVNFVYRHYPLPQHSNARIAAQASEAAAKQNKFWEMHDKLFENQTTWENSTNALAIFTTYAKDLGLNTDQFAKDVESSAVIDKIQKDKDDGDNLGINATPTFFIDGVRYEGVINYDTLKTVLNKELTSK